MTSVRAWGWYGLCFRAMNTQVEIQLYTDADDVAVDGRIAPLSGVQRMFRKAEEHLSRFDRASELSQLNRSAGHPRRVSPLLFDVIEMAVWAASVTRGLFDPTLLKAMEAIGYDRSFEQIRRHEGTAGRHDTGRLGPLPRQGRYQAIGLNRPRQEIVLPPDVQLDLGGIGKGWTVDRAADWLAGWGPFLINAGGDLYAYGAPPGQPGWSIGIEDPWRPELDTTRIQVRQRAVATSTISRRQWQQGGRLMHHLIDPRSGQPAETDAVSVTVVAQRTALAEVYAKVALIMGVEEGLAWLNNLPEVEGLLVRADGQLIYTNGFTNYLEVINDDAIASQPHDLPPAGPYDLGHRHPHRRADRASLAWAGIG